MIYIITIVCIVIIARIILVFIVDIIVTALTLVQNDLFIKIIFRLERIFCLIDSKRSLILISISIGNINSIDIRFVFEIVIEEYNLIAVNFLILVFTKVL